MESGHLDGSRPHELGGACARCLCRRHCHFPPSQDLGDGRTWSAASL